jgi:TRAP-type transport system periplasmic protein
LRFVDDISKRSNGTLALAILPSSQLGDLRELMEFTQRGSPDMNINTSGIAAIFVPDMKMFNLPFLFADSRKGSAFYASERGSSASRS